MTFPFVGTHTAAEWADWYRTNASVAEGGVALATDPFPSFDPPRRVGEGGFETVDVTVDGCGTAYVLTADGDVYRYDATQDRLTRLACVWNPEDGGEPAAIAATEDTLYVADRGTGRVQALSAHLLQTRWIAEGLEDPVGLTVSEGTVYALDGGDPSAPMTTAQGRLRRVGPDGDLRTVAEHMFNPVDVATDGVGNVVVLGSRPATAPVVKLFEPASLADVSATGATADVRIPPSAFAVAGSGRPVAPTCVEAVGVGEVLVGVGAAGPGEAGLFRYRPDEDGFEPLPVVDGSTVALQTGVPDREGVDPELYAVDGEGDLRLFDAAGRTYRRTGEGAYRGAVVGRFDAGERGIQWHRLTFGLHRGDGRARARSQVRVQFAATDDDWLPAGGDASPSDPPTAIDGIGRAYGRRLRDAGVIDLGALVELPAGELALVLGTDSHSVSLSDAAGLLADARAALGRGEVDVDRFEWRELDRPNPEDALVPDAEGRYLWVRLVLVGDERVTPRVDSVRAYFPRQSYLRHLPAVYREDPSSAAFLERYLSLFESTFVDIEEQIASASKYADPAGIPTEHLDWLGEWLAVEADETWSTPALRALIRRAPDLYRKRGTAEGLLATVRLYLRHADAGVTPLDDPKPSIPGDATAIRTGGGSARTDVAGDAETDGAETDELRGDDGESGRRVVWLIEHGDLTCIDADDVEVLYHRLISCTRGFLVLLHPDVSDEAAAAIDRLVEAQQPAHATGRTVHLRDATVLNGTGDEVADARGYHTYLGVNSRLSSREFALGDGVLGQDSRLAEREPDGHLELQSRLGEDARLG
ncbi:phage tail protein [Halosimplex amylolyticum]|uniref:phage tail protein n=1 Tax=Halosimplex amylolyticum TaxID=3396616 RepID=UPI003F57D77A